MSLSTNAIISAIYGIVSIDCFYLHYGSSFFISCISGNFLIGCLALWNLLENSFIPLMLDFNLLGGTNSIFSVGVIESHYWDNVLLSSLPHVNCIIFLFW
jgi:hypothetical protein